MKRILNRRSAGIMLAVSSAVLFLSACAVPPSVQIASWVADGISYIATQKSLTDHGISFLAQRDCALWRGVKGEAICRDPDSGTVAVASNEGDKTTATQRDEKSAAKAEADSEKVIPANFETASGDPRQGGETPDEPFAAPVRAAPWGTAVVAGQRGRGRIRKATPAEAVAGSGLFYVIGSFKRFDLAKALVQRVQRQGALNARLVDASLRGSRLYRVVVGPFDQSRQYYVYRRIAAAGIDGAWATIMTLPAGRRTRRTRRTVAQAPPNEGRPVKSPAPGLHYVIGSFSDPGNAFGLAKRMAALAPDVITSRGGGGIYRVVVGPFSGEGIGKGQRGIRRAGIAGAWPVYLNPAKWNIAESRDSDTGRRLSEAPVFRGNGAS